MGAGVRASRGATADAAGEARASREERRAASWSDAPRRPPSRAELTVRFVRREPRAAACTLDGFMRKHDSLCAQPDGARALSIGARADGARRLLLGAMLATAPPPPHEPLPQPATVRVRAHEPRTPFSRCSLEPISLACASSTLSSLGGAGEASALRVGAHALRADRFARAPVASLLKGLSAPHAVFARARSPPRSPRSASSALAGWASAAELGGQRDRASYSAHGSTASDELSFTASRARAAAARRVVQPPLDLLATGEQVGRLSALVSIIASSGSEHAGSRPAF